MRSPTCRHHRSLGMARAEGLFLFAVFLVLGSLTFPLYVEWRNYRGTMRAYAELRLLVTAADLYNREYRLWPVPDASGRYDVRVGSSDGNRAIGLILRGIDGDGNEEHRANVHRIDFLALASDGGRLAMPRLDSEGNFVDPWGRAYQMVFDANYDSVCSIPESSYADVVGEGVVMWSMGPDRASDNDDDPRTWTIQ